MNNVALDVTDNVTAAYAVRRNAGFWAALGSGFNGEVDCIAVDDYGRIWFGGNFTTANGVTVNYITYWDGTTFQAIGGDTKGADGRVRAIAIDANGEDVIFCGDFANVAGAAKTRICKYDVSAGTFSAYGSGLNNTGRALLVTRAGRLYVGGTFTTANGVTVNRVCYWNGSTFVAMDSGVSATVYALAESAAGWIVAGGTFSTAGSGHTTVNKVTYWNGSSWQAMGDTPGVNDTVYAIEITPADEWFIGGAFTTADGITVNRIAGFNSNGFYALDDGLPDVVWSLKYNPYDKKLWVGGDFLYAGSNVAVGYIGTWSGAAWCHVDINLPGGFTVAAIAFDGERVYLGGDASGTAAAAGSATATSTGTAGAPPIFTVRRSGGTAATIESFINTTTGKRLIMRYVLASGETLTINLATGKVISSSKGEQIGVIFPDSDIATWLIEPGANVIATFAYTSGSPTITAYVQWENHYLAIDGAAA